VLHNCCRSTTTSGTRAGLRICAAFGGLSKFDQVKELKAGTEVGRDGVPVSEAVRKAATGPPALLGAPGPPQALTLLSQTPVPIKALRTL
jgi:hypothetical protein